VTEEVLRAVDIHTYFYTLNSVVKAVRGIDFSLHRGEILGMVGESGSGKSVACLSLLKLVPTPGRIVGGKVIIEGHNIIEKDDEWIRKNIRGRKISMVFQDPLSALNPTYTIGWQMKEALFLHDKSMRKMRDVKGILIDTLLQMHMSDPEEILYKYPHQLSGGMRQRAVIATALLANPSILIADEPTTSLDVTVEARVMDLFAELRSSLNLSVLLVSHDLNLITERCDRTLVMYGGLIMESGESQQLFEHPRNPYTAALIKCTPPLHVDRSLFEPIPGDVIDLASPPAGCPFHPRCFNKGSRCETVTPELTSESGGRQIRCHCPLD
jgi:oligopeptide/dipeptide ABC transporter ATP-binding protein